MAEDSRKSPEEILCLSFNQDASCLAVGRPRGFDIFSTESTALLHREDCGVVKLVEMLFRTSLVALVGDNLSRQLTMWNTKARAGICSLQFPSEISSVKMNHRRAVVLLRQKVHIFDLKTMKVLHVIDRSDQAPGLDPGLCSLCCDPERGLLAAPLVAGSQGASLEARAGLVGVVDTYTLQPLGAVLAHRTPVRAMRLNPTGQLLATASARGTVLRLWAVPSFTMLCSFRRGANECCIHGLAFSTDSLNLMAAAANGTVHIFRSPKEAVDCVAPCAQEPVEAERLQAPASREIEEDDDLSEWNIVDCDRSRVRFAHFERKGLQGHVHKVKSILTQLWQPCRDYLDGPGAVAWVHQGKEESNLGPRSASPRSPPLGPLLPLPSAMLEIFTPAFQACLRNPQGGAGGGRLVVASRARNMLSTFDWNKGEGLLVSRQVLSAPAAQAEDARLATTLLQTPPMHPISPTPLIEAAPASPTGSSQPRSSSPPPFELDAEEGHVEMKLVVQGEDDLASASSGGEPAEGQEKPAGLPEPAEAEEADDISEAYEEDFEKSSEDEAQEQAALAASLELQPAAASLHVARPPPHVAGSPELLPAEPAEEASDGEAYQEVEEETPPEDAKSNDDMKEEAEMDPMGDGTEVEGQEDEVQPLSGRKELHEDEVGAEIQENEEQSKVGEVKKEGQECDDSDPEQEFETDKEKNDIQEDEEEEEEEDEEVEEEEPQEDEEEEEEEAGEEETTEGTTEEEERTTSEHKDSDEAIQARKASPPSRRERRAQRREEKRTKAVMLPEQDLVPGVAPSEPSQRRRKKGRRRSEDLSDGVEESRKQKKPLRGASSRQEEELQSRAKEVSRPKAGRGRGKRDMARQKCDDDEASENEVLPTEDSSALRKRRTPRR